MYLRSWYLDSNCQTIHDPIDRDGCAWIQLGPSNHHSHLPTDSRTTSCGVKDSGPSSGFLSLQMERATDNLQALEVGTLEVFSVCGFVYAMFALKDIVFHQRL